MPKIAFEPCIPTRGTKVPTGPDWIHEIKHDGYRLIVQRDGTRVRLFTGNDHDWTGRYPLIVEAALKNDACLTGFQGVIAEAESNGHEVTNKHPYKGRGLPGWQGPVCDMALVWRR
jgi:hypothetical protein